MSGERDVTSQLNVLMRPDELAFGQASRHAAAPERAFSVTGCPVLLPEGALSSGLEHLALATEERVPVRDYAEAVGLTLAALAKRGVLIFLA